MFWLTDLLICNLQGVEDKRTVFGEDVVEPFPEKEAFLAVDDGARGELAVVAAFGS